jgi:hypothetical protein
MHHGVWSEATRQKRFCGGTHSTWDTLPMQGDRDETRGLALQASRRQVDGPTSAEGRAKIAAAARARHARAQGNLLVPIRQGGNFGKRSVVTG